MTGRTIAHYQILEKLGEGGMGVVYRAHDSRLNRDVAIKVLSDRVTSVPGRKARFEREARLLATLSHPNVAAIHGMEEADGQSCLVLELVEGQTLAERLNKGRIPLEEALDICRQIAAGLEAAHEKGVVHRDLKPANIKLTPEGQVKILDFGLAKAFHEPELLADPSQSPTATAQMTNDGVILGTAAYMSPEQARGKPADKRADIWAFGCILYECLTEKRAFAGESASDVLAAILKAEPDWGALPAQAPAGISRLLRRCLRKDPQQRLHDIADARIEIAEAAGEEVPVPRGSRRRTAPWVWAPILIAVAAAFGAGVWWHSLRPLPERSWSGVRLGGSMVAIGPRVSPDGQLVAFQAFVDNITQVAVMKPESGNWTVLTHDRSLGSVQEICWARDGTKLYFDRIHGVPRGVFSVPVLGGEERLVVEDARFPQVLPDGSLLMVRLNAARQSQLHRFWPETGRLQALPALIRSNVPSATYRVSPRGDRAIFLGKPLADPNSPDHLYAMDLGSETIIRLAPEISIPVTIPFALAVAADGRSVLFGLPMGDLSRIVSVPSDGSRGLHTLLALTTITGYLDVGTDGSLYADQWERPNEVVRLTPSDGTVEVIAESADVLALPLPDQRIAFASRTSGRDRLLVAGTGKEPAPLVETQEETAMPAALVGRNQVAFMIGQRPNQTIAVASISDGRVIRRLNGPKGSAIRSIAALPDGTTIYYTAAGSVWAIPLNDGQPRKLCSGDFVTVDAFRQELIVRLDERESVRLVRVPLAGGPERPVRVEGDARLVSGHNPLGPTAVARDGRILVQVQVGSSWFWPAGVLDPNTGRVSILKIGYPADMPAPGWTAEGKVVVVAKPFRSSLWRFR